ncbi:hypothetical protein BGZ60DRAFT_412178 [Tricladium varicosporioides]|nr:hypothetical protein BGZ60DRAFT_412178 [Hymenoscyphus varicosporioides]
MSHMDNLVPEVNNASIQQTIEGRYSEQTVNFLDRPDDRRPQGLSCCENYRDFVGRAKDLYPDISPVADYLSSPLGIRPHGPLTVSIVDIGSEGIISQKQWDDTPGRLGNISLHVTQSDFAAAIDGPPLSGTRTRIINIHVERLYADSRELQKGARSLPSVIETLGGRFNIDVRFFLKLVHFLSRDHSPTPTRRIALVRKPAGVGDGYLDMYTREALSLKPIYQRSECFLGALTIRQSVGGAADYNILVTLNSTSGINGTDFMKILNPPLSPIDGYKLRGVRDVKSFLLQTLLSLTPEQIRYANTDLLGFLAGPIELHCGLMRCNIEQARGRLEQWHQKLVYSSNDRFDDEMINSYWNIYRSALEDFKSTTRNWVSFCRSQQRRHAQNANPQAGNFPHRVALLTSSLNELIDEALALETLMRDLIQLNIGNVALKESRQSLTQSKSVRRVTLLAFVVLPLSLVTSFFGMNVEQLTGNGPHIKFFVIAAVAISALLFFCWLIVSNASTVKGLLPLSITQIRQKRKTMRMLREVSRIR